MAKINCLNPIAACGMDLFNDTYEETLQKGLFSRVYNFQTPGNILIYRLRRYMR